MKVVIATTTNFHLANIAIELDKIGHDVTYISYHPSFRIKKLGVKKHISLFWTLFPFSFAAIFRYMPRLQNYFVNLMFEKTDIQIKKILPECDVFIGLSCMSNLCADIARDKYGAKIIIERGSRHVRSQVKLTNRDGIESFSKNYIERELNSYSKADYIALPSWHAVNSFIEEGISHNKLFKNIYGVDLNKFKNLKLIRKKVINKEFVLGFVGCWSYRKGVDVLIKTINEIDNIKLIHAGTIGDIEFPQSVKFKSLGHISHSELNEKVYSNCDALVLPSREDGFGLVLLEAMASGLPIIASTMTGAPDIHSIIKNKKAVTLVAPGCTESLKAGIIDAMNFITNNNTSILDENDVDYFSWKSYGYRYNKFISEIINDGN